MLGIKKSEEKMDIEKFKKLELKLMKKITKSDNDSRYIYNGIHYCSKTKKGVVTNGRVLFATPNHYDDKLNDLTIATANYLPLEGKFPDYEKVVWNKEENAYKIEDIKIPMLKSVSRGEYPIFLSENGFSVEKPKEVLAAVDLKYLEMLQDFQRFGIKFNVYFREETQSIIFEFIKNPEIVFVLMPLKLSGIDNLDY